MRSDGPDGRRFGQASGCQLPPIVADGHAIEAGLHGTARRRFTRQTDIDIRRASRRHSEILPAGASRAPDARSRASRELELTVRGAAFLRGRRSIAPARDRAPSRPRRWKLDAQSLGLCLEERLGIGKAREAMSAEIAEPDAGRGRCPDRCSGRGGYDDLTSVSGRADTRRGVNRQTDVADVGQLRAAAVDPGTDPYLVDRRLRARAPSSRWIATAASMAAAARSKTAKNSSARASISWPPARDTAALMTPLTSLRSAP